MTESCEICDGDGHVDDAIWVEGKMFCPNTHHRIWTEEDVEEMSYEELEKAERERIKIVKPARPAEWKIVEESK